MDRGLRFGYWAVRRFQGFGGSVRFAHAVAAHRTHPEPRHKGGLFVLRAREVNVCSSDSGGLLVINIRDVHECVRRPAVHLCFTFERCLCASHLGGLLVLHSGQLHACALHSGSLFVLHIRADLNRLCFWGQTLAS